MPLIRVISDYRIMDSYYGFDISKVVNKRLMGIGKVMHFFENIQVIKRVNDRENLLWRKTIKQTIIEMCFVFKPFPR